MRLNRRTVTDDAGRFQFADLPAGRFTITAAKAGYPETSYGARRPFRTGSGVMLAEGQRLTDIQLPLAKGAVLTGTVFDDRGQPMPGVPIMAWEVRSSLSGERTLDMPATGGEWVTSDDRGMYRVFGLPPGEYTIGTAWFFSGGEADVRVPSDAEIRAAFLAVTPDRQRAAAGPDCGAGASGAAALQLHAGLLPERGRPARGRDGEDRRWRRTQRHGPAHAVPSDGAHRRAGDGTRRPGG